MFTPNQYFNPRVVCSAVLSFFLALVLGGCQKPGQVVGETGRGELRTTLKMFSGQDGRRLTWPQLMEASADADVLILGEQHDDAVGHAVQLAIVEDILARRSGGALSMEMLDRGEQAFVDDYLAGIINREKFIEQTASTRWRKISRDYLEGKIDKQTFGEKIRKLGWPDWENNYQPIIDAAKSHSARVIAANTPWARYTRLANKNGYDHLNSLSSSQKALFELPRDVLRGPYRERFWEVIAGRPEGEPARISDEAGKGPENVHSGLSDEKVLGMFRAQLVMDATMADSIADALQNGAAKVIHLVGQFHSDFNGGVVQELKHRRPGARILTVSLQRAKIIKLRKEDRGRADVVIYTK